MDVTFCNTTGPSKGQVVSVRNGRNYPHFIAVILKATYQDTLHTYSQRQFYKECDNHGTINWFHIWQHNYCVPRLQHLSFSNYWVLSSTINVYSLLSHELWVLLIKFMMGLTIHARMKSMHLWYSRSI